MVIMISSLLPRVFFSSSFLGAGAAGLAGAAPPFGPKKERMSAGMMLCCEEKLKGPKWGWKSVKKVKQSDDSNGHLIAQHNW